MVEIFDDLETLSAAAAREIAGTLAAAVHARGKGSIALSGGDTPGTLYQLLATEFSGQIPWPQLHVFWSDERYVTPDDPRSNYRLARETLLDRVPCPPANIHPMPTDLDDPRIAAVEYEAVLRAFFPAGLASFDVSILGIGPDAHTASLFPGSPALDARTQWVAPVTAPADPPQRLTLTPPALTAAARTHVLVAGAGKAEALRHALHGDDVHRYPAVCLRQATGMLTWWVDKAAHGAL
jgi:6-phosphogluconolactonase